MPDWPLWADVNGLLCCLLLVATIVRGAAPERILAAALCSGGLLLCLSNHLTAFAPVTSFGFVLRAIDVVVFTAVLTVALHVNRVYPLYMAAAQLVKLIAAYWTLRIGVRVSAAHALIDLATVDLQLLVLALGLACHLKRLRGSGRRYPDWMDGMPRRSR